MSPKKLASIISVILGPHVLIPILFFIVISKSGLTACQSKVIIPSALILQVALPIIYLLLAPKLGWVSQWDMKKKEERLPFFIIMLASSITMLAIIYFFGNRLLLHLNLTVLILLIVLMSTTIYWRISLHSSLNTAAAIIVNFLFDWKLPILYLLIPLVGWARLKLNKHTFSQVAAGVIVTSAISFIGLTFFGYL